MYYAVQKYPATTNVHPVHKDKVPALRRTQISDTIRIESAFGI